MKRKRSRPTSPSTTRIAVYTDYTYHRAGGNVYAERAFALFLSRLSLEFERMVIVGKVDPTAGVARYQLPSEIGFVELPYYASMASPKRALGAMARSVSAFWRLLPEVDCVWLLGPHPLAIVFASLAAVRRTRVALGVRQDFPRYVRARHPGRRWIHLAGDALELVWRLMARACRVVVVGPSLAAGYSIGRTLEITVSLVRESDIRDAEHGAGQSFADDELRVLTVGRLEEEKNPLLLADIIAGLLTRDPRWRLLVCGEGPLDDALRARLDELGVSEVVQLLGYVPHDRGLRELYRSSHAFLHVSWTEGLPQVLFEAFAARLPVAATAVGGVVSVGSAAITFPPGDADVAVRALERLRTEPSLRETLIDAGIDLVSSRTLDREAHKVATFLGD